MGFFDKLITKTQQKLPEKKKITDLTDLERAEIEDQTRIGRSARDIASALNLNVEVIYNYRRVLTDEQKKTATDPTAEILKAKIQEREILKQDFELEKLRLDLEQKKQQIEIDRIEFQRDMKEWKESLSDGDKDDDINLGTLFSGIMQAMNKPAPTAPSQNTSKVVVGDPPKTQEVTDKLNPSAAEMQATLDGIKAEEEEYITMSDDEIRRIISGFEKKEIKLAKLLPDTVLFDKIAEKFPTLSDQSIDRAIQIFRTEY